VAHRTTERDFLSRSISHWFALKSPSKSKAEQRLKKVQPAMELSRDKNTKGVNEQKGKKSMASCAHTGWAG